MEKKEKIDMMESKLTENIIGAAIEVHDYWGPGLVESIYELSLAHELKLRGMRVSKQVPFNLKYKDLHLRDDYRVDLIVEDKIVIELKSINDLAPIHYAQLMTYLKLTKCPLGLLINFNVVKLRDGIKRIKF
jgi:GxxExxY protein